MNLTDLTRRVRRHLAEAGAGVHQDADIQAELNRSARTLAAENALFKGVAAAVATDGMAPLPADLLSVVSVTAAPSGYALAPVDLTAAMNSNLPQAGAVTGYAFDEAWGRKLYVFPAGAATLNVVYRRAPAPMTQPGDEAWGGAYEAYHDLIALHAAHQLAGQTGSSAAKDAVWLQRFAQRREEFRAHLALQALDTPPMRVMSGPRRRRR